jgi:fimbrial chaperone protein
MARRRFLVPMAALLALCAEGAGAGALRVMPVRVEVAAGRQFCSLTLGNDSDHPVTVQVRGFGWSRDESGEDRLDPATGPLVNPAIATIPAGENRLVRCSLPATGQSAATGEAAGTEQQWRLIVDELPRPAAELAPGTVQTLLRLSVPVFRTPADARPALNWSIVRPATGEPLLALANAGRRRAQVVKLVLHLKDGRELAVPRGFYLLAQGRLALPLPAEARDRVSAITAETDLGPLPVTAASAGEDPPGRKLVLVSPAD